MCAVMGNEGQFGHLSPEGVSAEIITRAHKSTAARKRRTVTFFRKPV
jgi:hypothetical protein